MGWAVRYRLSPSCLSTRRGMAIMYSSATSCFAVTVMKGDLGLKCLGPPEVVIDRIRYVRGSKNRIEAPMTQVEMSRHTAPDSRILIL